MIQLSKSGSTVTFTFDENSGYLQNGTINVPVNSLSLILDESNMATFRKSASNDIFVSALYSDFGMSKSELEAWYKANMVGSGGGGGGGVTPEEVQGMIDESISGKADSVSAVSSAEYVSSSTTIEFKNVDGDVISSIDASDFVIDGMIDDVRIETISGASYLVIDFNTASGKEDIQIPLTDIFDPSNYYTKSEVDDAISAATDDMATQTWVGEQGYLTEHQSLSAYSTTEEMNSAIEGATSGKADTSAVTAVNNVLTAHTADTTIHVTSADKTAWNAKSDFSGSYNDLTDKPTIPTVPTSNTAFTNDAGYATSGYVDSAVSGKQDTLVSGTNIKTINNQSLLGSGNIDIQGGGSGSSTVELTQAEYDALVSGGTVDPTTYYIITDATPIDINNYYTSAQTDSAISAATSGKADSTDVTAEINAATSGKVDTSAITSAVTSASTDSEIPTAKAVYDAIPTGGTGGGKAISAGTNISVTTGETADTINCTLPIYLQGETNLNYGSNNNTLKNSRNSTYNSIFGINNTIDKSGSNLQYACRFNTIFGDYNTLFVNSNINNLTNNFIYGKYNVISSSTESIYSSVALGSTNKGTRGQQALIGWNNQATNYKEVSIGTFNNSVSASTTFGDSGNTLFSVGNGTADDARHNAFEIRQNGDIYLTKDGVDIKLQDNLGGGAASSAITSGDTNAVSSDAVYTAMGGLKLQQITQADYDALVSGGTVDASTLYIITNVVN